ncbi:hypothetical protein BMR05_14105 [Methylococcaceae bacterium HT4]|nr:hypothetical protein BMR05_14105 [Methylococcaceae bacterium HT4]TXL17680.1 hypothetical protein BMR06_14620 [Methylococcaceae bacterium HT5]
MATTNGSTAIRDKILASLARYRALRIGKFPCAFWRLSSRPGLTAVDAGIKSKLINNKQTNILWIVLIFIFYLCHAGFQRGRERTINLLQIKKAGIAHLINH